MTIQQSTSRLKTASTTIGNHPAGRAALPSLATVKPSQMKRKKAVLKPQRDLRPGVYSRPIGSNGQNSACGFPMPTHPATKDSIRRTTSKANAEAANFAGLGELDRRTLPSSSDFPKLGIAGQQAQVVPSLARDHSELQESEPKFRIGWSVLAFLPSWLVSLIFHLTILLVLAVITLSVQDRGRGLVVEIAEADQLGEDIVMTITSPREELELSLEDISAADEMGADRDSLPVLSNDMLHQFDHADLYAANSEPGNDLQVIPDGKSGMGSGESGASGDSKESASFYGMEASGKQFVFVIDCSGSMAHGYRWYRAVAELKKSISNLNEDQEFTIFLYNTRVWSLFGEEPASAGLHPATEDIKTRAGKWLDRAQPFADTFPGYSMQLSLRLYPDAIFMLSDGEFHDDTVRKLRVWNSGADSAQIPINTVFLGRGPGRFSMQTIANDNLGEFVWAE
ncbi:MAG: hypothetical protein AAF939_17750 [Planctomycetota bacterium]